MPYDLLVTQLVNLLRSVRIAEKVRMGLPYPCVVSVNTSAMPVTSQRAIRLRGVKCGITRVSPTWFTRSWDRAILTGINTWVNLESDSVSCPWMIPVRVSAGVACHRLKTHACVYGIASARALC